MEERHAVCSVGWFVSLLVHEEVLLADLCERKILFWLEIYDRLRQATAKRTGLISYIFLIEEQYFSLTINQLTVLLAIIY